MPNTIKLSTNNRKITISDIDSDWTWSDTIDSTTWPQGIRLWCIKFTPVQADDKCVIHEDGDADDNIFDVTCRDIYDDKIWYYPDVPVMPKLIVASGSYAAGTKITIWLRP